MEVTSVLVNKGGMVAKFSAHHISQRLAWQEGFRVFDRTCGRLALTNIGKTSRHFTTTVLGQNSDFRFQISDKVLEKQGPGYGPPPQKQWAHSRRFESKAALKE